ncbi:hypothetical protein BCU43_000640 [Vibrio lentus]|jgi:hypothetical protein|nr:hypothetical protein [Vibrio lentus]PMI58355.1 hypothetical protein BCU43_01225 [Vibrio lentus]
MYPTFKFAEQAYNLRDDYRSEKPYDKIVVDNLSQYKQVVHIAEKLDISFEEVIDVAIWNNLAIRKQNLQRHDNSVINRYTEQAFLAIFGGKDLNKFDPCHEGWDIDFLGMKIEIKATRKSKVNAKQGSKPDFYVIFKLDHEGRLDKFYCLPVELLKARRNGVPKTINLGGTHFSERFQISFEKLKLFFHRVKYNLSGEMGNVDFGLTYDHLDGMLRVENLFLKMSPGNPSFLEWDSVYWLLHRTYKFRYHKCIEWTWD